MEITLDMSKGALEIAKKVFLRELTRSEGKIEINKHTGMNEGSAQDFITIFLAMMSGNVYKRAFNNATNKFLLENIRQEFGEESFRKALKAVQQHIDYYSTLGKGRLTGLQRIIDQMK